MMQPRANRTLTFEQFQSTRRYCTDLGAACADARWENEVAPARGWLYLDSLYIEEVCAPIWKAECIAQGKWYLIIGRDETITDDLEALEHELFQWCATECYTADDALGSMIGQYEAWNAEQGLKLASADEHVHDESLSDAQRAWLVEFCARWDIVRGRQ